MNWSKYIIIILIGAFGIYLLYSFLTRELEINGFTGRLTAYEGNSITVFGVYKSDSREIPESFRQSREFKFFVSELTKIEKEVIQWPDDLGTLGEEFDLADLPRSKVAGSLEELKQLFGNVIFIEVGFDISIINSIEPVAYKMIYRVFSLNKP